MTSLFLQDPSWSDPTSVVGIKHQHRQRRAQKELSGPVGGQPTETVSPFWGGSRLLSPSWPLPGSRCAAGVSTEARNLNLYIKNSCILNMGNYFKRKMCAFQADENKSADRVRFKECTFGICVLFLTCPVTPTTVSHPPWPPTSFPPCPGPSESPDCS